MKRTGLGLNLIQPKVDASPGRAHLFVRTSPLGLDRMDRIGHPLKKPLSNDSRFRSGQKIWPGLLVILGSYTQSSVKVAHKLKGKAIRVGRSTHISRKVEYHTCRKRSSQMGEEWNSHGLIPW